MSRQRPEMEFAIIGLGRLGQSLARTLVERGCRVLGIDQDAVLVQRLSPEFPCTVLDATDEAALRDLDIPAFDAVVVAIGSNFESNLLTTVALKSLGVRQVVCQSPGGYQREILLQVGADRVVEPQSDAGQRLARELTMSAAGERIPLGLDHTVARLKIPEAVAGQPLAQLDLTRPDVSVLAIQRDEELLVGPPPHTVVLVGDFLVVLGSNEAVTALGPL